MIALALLLYAVGAFLWLRSKATPAEGKGTLTYHRVDRSAEIAARLGGVVLALAAFLLVVLGIVWIIIADDVANVATCSASEARAVHSLLVLVALVL